MQSCIHNSLKKDSKAHVERVGDAIKAALEGNELQEAWNIAKA